MQEKITEALDNFSQSALCDWLNRPGASNAVSVLATRAIFVPDPATTLAGLGLLATQMGCAFNPTNPTEKVECMDGWKGIFYDATNCEDQEGYNDVYIWGNVGSEEQYVYWESFANVKTFDVSWREVPGTNVFECSLSGRYKDSTATSWDFVLKRSSTVPCLDFRQNRDIDIDCVGKPYTGPPPPFIAPSPELNCTLKAELQNYQLLPNGSIVPVIKYTNLSADTRSGPEISGCNWYGDLIFTGGGGGQPPTIGPLPPAYDGPPAGPGIPDWLQDFFSGLAAELAADAIRALFDQPIPGITYEMIAPCDKDSEGNPLVWTKEIPEAKWLDALGLRITALNAQMSQHLAWKTPICNERPTLEGDWRTISFRSDSASPYGNARLRKRFRYRSTSGLGLGEIVDYWKDFTFQSGPVVVCHSGSSWGTPQVWAATADEGKRVIRHAAGEAGIDPDQVGRWTISGSRSARYGVSDTMRVDKRKGYWWITSRDGSNNRPIVAETSYP